MENGRMARQKTSDGFLLQKKRDFQLASSRVELETLWTTKLNLKKKEKERKKYESLVGSLLILYNSLTFGSDQVFISFIASLL